MDFLQNIDVRTVLVQFAVLIFSLSLHEASHAWAADRLGDSTARYLGRVTMNPLRHLDPIGTLLFPVLQIVAGLPVIGWAKPVPVNLSHLGNPRRGQVYISLAGPGSNLLAASLIFVLLAILKLGPGQAGALIKNMIVTMSIPQNQGLMALLIGILVYMLVVNLALALFNLIPLPPLDGHWLLYELLPERAGKVLAHAGGFGILILYGFVFLGLLRFLFIPIWWLLGILLHL